MAEEQEQLSDNRIGVTRMPMPRLYQELIWFGIAGPLFGFACAHLAQESGRRQWLWAILGYFFTFVAVMALIILNELNKRGTNSRTR